MGPVVGRRVGCGVAIDVIEQVGSDILDRPVRIACEDALFVTQVVVDSAIVLGCVISRDWSDRVVVRGFTVELGSGK